MATLNTAASSRVVQLSDTHLMRESGGQLVGIDTDRSLAAVCRLVAAQGPIDALLLSQNGDLQRKQVEYPPRSAMKATGGSIVPVLKNISARNSIVFVFLSLLFADGGLSALGINVFNMAIVTSLVGWLVITSWKKLFGEANISIISAKL